MADYLGEKDWKLELKKHKDVKDTGISECLRDYARYQEKNADKALAALETLTTKATAAQRTHQNNKELKKYLDDLLGAAIKASAKLEAESKEGDKDKKAPKIDKALRAGLKRAKTSHMYFAVVAKGSADGRLLVAKAKVKPSEIELAKKETGGTKVFRGRVFGEDGRMIFELLKEPPPLLAKLIKKLAKAQAGLMMKPICRAATAKNVDEKESPSDPQTKKLAVAYKQWSVARGAAKKGVQTLQIALLKADDPRAKSLAKGLSNVLNQLPPVREPLSELLGALSAGDQDVESINQLKREAAKQAKACQSFLTSDPLFAHLDSNPFVSLKLRQPMIVALREINILCSA